ncbi:MAG TPA: hypothetical protein VEB42_02595 [Chitinophagaceae bacterium]|nr:hypothetical protein [Chitinophagaceae bacterium]
MLPPLTAVAVNVTDVPAQTGPEGDDEMETDGTTWVITFAVNEFDVAVSGDAQVSLDERTTVTTSPLFRVELLKVELLVPASTPFIFHW